VHTSAKARLASVAIRIRIQLNYLFIDPLPTFPENCLQIRLEAFAQSC